MILLLTFVVKSTLICNEFRYSYRATFSTKFREKYYGVYLWSAAVPATAIVSVAHHAKPRPNVKSTYSTKPSQDDRQVARVFALALGILFIIIFVLQAISF
jgi:hypothetical protein